MTKPGEPRVEFANTLRGVAALSVLAEHYCSFFTGSRSVIASLINAPVMPDSIRLEPDYMFWAYSIPHLIWGSLGVSLFFIISGFVIPFSLKNSTPGAFLFGRFFRIYPLYAAGFTITLASIGLTSLFFGRPWPFALGQVAQNYVPGSREFLRFASIDGIVWTLEIEIKFYLICALIAPWLRRGSLKVFFVPVAIVIIDHLLNLHLPGYSHTVSATGSPYLAFMFIGTAFHYMHIKALRTDLGLVIISTLFLAFCLSIAYGPNPAFVTIFWSFGFAILLFGFAFRFPRLFGKSTIGEFFADISYPLYVIHGISGYALMRILVEFKVPAWLALPITVAVIFTVARVLNRTVEKWGRLEGKRLYASLSPKPKPEAARGHR